MSAEKTQDESLRAAFRQFHYELHIAECPAEKIKPPKYEMRLMGGGSKSFYHDEQSIKAAPNEEKRAWAAYQERLEKLHNAECLVKEATEEEQEVCKLELLPIYKAYRREVVDAKDAFRLTFLEAQLHIGYALTWPS